MPRRLPDLTKVTRLIGYQTRHTLDDILDDVVEHFRKK
jgi:nucleoside-diphosphate-sugar epimerase